MLFLVIRYLFTSPCTHGQSEPTATNALVGRSVHWMGYVFSFGAKWDLSQSFFFWFLTTVLFFFFLLCDSFSHGPDLTHSYPIHFPTLISIAPTLVLYLLSPTDIATLITSYPIDLATVLTTYPTNLATLLITYPINLTTVLTTYLTNLHTQPLYWHKYFTNLVTLIR
jgi:hypothetical protein